jgi:phospholipid/cholesterol/gamma-HCH transport system substrate-binding protein
MKITNEFKIGLMAIAVIGLSVWGYTFLRGKNLLKTANIYYVRYLNIDQLAPTSPVLIRGFQVGTVSDVQLDEDMTTIIVTLDIEKGIKIPKDAIAYVVNVSIMGGKAVELQIKGACSGDQCAEPGSFLEGRVRGMFDSLLDGGEDGTLAKVKENIGDILNTLGDSLTSPNANNEIAKTYTQLSALITNLSSITGTLDRSMSTYDRHLSNSLANISSITGAFARNQDKIASTIQNLERISDQLDKAKLGETAVNTNKLITDAQGTIRELNIAVEEAQNSFTKLSGVMNDIQSGKGSLGKLLKDEKLYNHALATTRNLDLLLQDFRLNPKRYVNVSVFGKKQKEYVVPSDDPADQIEEEIEE